MSLFPDGQPKTWNRSFSRRDNFTGCGFKRNGLHVCLFSFELSVFFLLALSQPEGSASSVAWEFWLSKVKVDGEKKAGFKAIKLPQNAENFARGRGFCYTYFISFFFWYFEIRSHVALVSFRTLCLEDDLELLTLPPHPHPTKFWDCRGMPVCYFVISL